MSTTERLTGRFHEGDRVRHHKSQRTGTVRRLAKGFSGYLQISWDDQEQPDWHTYWPPTGFVLLDRQPEAAR